jgi:1-aminocyclopropane-1-carboxylate deaminase/D-cysteine desulfhydrase-like pyridoxal-dependent ACC family enzyme
LIPVRFRTRRHAWRRWWTSWRASGLSRPEPNDLTLRLDDGQIGSGYEAFTDEARRAIDNAGSSEGLVLEPVYTAKALAGLTAAVERDEIRPGERTVFVHTGGLPGLFGHPLAVELAARTRRAT